MKRIQKIGNDGNVHDYIEYDEEELQTMKRNDFKRREVPGEGKTETEER